MCNVCHVTCDVQLTVPLRFVHHGLDAGAKTSDVPDDAFLSARASRSKGEPQTPNPKPKTPNPKPQTPNSFAAPTHDIDPDRAKSLAREKRKETYGEALVQPLKLQPELG